MQAIRSISVWKCLGFSALGATVIWAYWPTLASMAHRWLHEPQYSHGFLVPLFALYLLWLRAKDQSVPLQGNWWGLPLLAAAGALRLAGAYFYITWLDDVSLLPCLLGLAVLFGGWPALRWSWPCVAFLLFMIPLPFRVEGALAHPLQRLATAVSTWLLVIVGIPATAEGNVITLQQGKIGVAHACSGLSMLMTFFALTVAYVLISRRPRADKILIVASAVPIALLANIVRITLTGILYDVVGSETARAFFHDVAGWFMMLIAVGMLWIELQILSRLFIETEDARPLSLGVSP